jgi:hypothetical protein
MNYIHRKECFGIQNFVNYFNPVIEGASQKLAITGNPETPMVPLHCVENIRTQWLISIPLLIISIGAYILSGRFMQNDVRSV